MNMGDIDVSLNRHLGLPDSYQLERAAAFRLYKYLNSICPGKEPVGMLTLLYYVDEHGDFTNSTKRNDMIINAIFKNMEKKDQFTVLQYINTDYGG